MKNEYKITKSLVKSWAKERYFAGAADVVLLILWSIVGVCGVGMIALLSLRGGDWLDWCLAVLFTILSIFKLFLAPHIIWARRYKAMSRLFGVSEWMRTVEFAPDAILFTEHNATNTLRYENIKQIKEHGDVVMLLCHDRLAIRLYKSAFTKGSWEECKQLILSKKQKN